MALDRVTNMVRFYIDLLRTQGRQAEFAFPPLISSFVTLQDVWFTVAMGSFLLMLRVVLERVWFPRLLSKYEPRVRQKIAENLFYFCFHSSFFCAGIAVILHEPWSVDFFSSNYMIDLYDDFPPPMTTWLRNYYLSELGFYLGSSVYLNLEKRRKDYIQFLVHHIATGLLMIVSFAIGYVRIGVLILPLHDAGDILLYGAKAVHYLGWAPFDTALFVVFMVVFYVTRLLFLPRVVFSVIFETFLIAADRPDFNQWTEYWHVYIIHWVVFIILLSVLIVLHSFWFHLIVRMAHREVTNPGSTSKEGDIRSDSEDDSDDD